MAETAAPPETEQPQQTATIPPDQSIQDAARPTNLQPTKNWPAPVIPNAPAPTEQAPKVLTPIKRPGLMGVLDEVGKWIGGTQGTETYIDPETGERFTQHPPLTHGQQWARAGATALRGAAAGWAAGKGAGNEGKALQAGVQAQDEAQDKANETDEARAQGDYNRQRQAKLDKADLQLKQVQLTQALLQNHRLEVGTSKDEQEAYQSKLQFLKDSGGEEIPGEYDSTDIHTVQRAQPDFLKNHAQFASIEPVQQPNGKVKFYGMPSDWATQPTGDAEAQKGWPTFVNGDPTTGTPGHMTYEPFTSGEYSKGAYAARLNGELAKQSTEAKAIHDLKKSETDEQPKTYQEALARASAATDPAEKKRYSDLANTMLRGEEALRVAGRNVTSVINQGQPGAGGAAATGRDENYLQTIAPEYRNQVRSIADGNIPMPPRGKEGMAVRNMVMNYDPTYTEARYKAKQEFKTGPDADKLVQLATVLEHAENALNNSDAAGVSPLGEHSYSTPVIQYNRDKNMFVGELGRLVKGGVVEQNEYDRLLKDLDSMVPSKRRDALTEDLNLLGGKIQGILQKYKNAVGTDLNPQEFFNDATQARLQRYNIVPAQPGSAPATPSSTPRTASGAPTYNPQPQPAPGGGFTVTDPTGNPIKFPTQAAANAAAAAMKKAHDAAGGR